MATLNIVPNAGQTLAVTRDPIRNNFSTIDAAFLVDHVPYVAAGQGQHNKITFPLQGAAPVFLTTNGLWSQNYAVTVGPEVWVQAKAGAGTNQYPLTASVLSANATPGNFSRGWTYLPSGIVMKWGRNASGVPFNLNGVAGEPDFLQVFSASVAPVAAAPTTTAFTINPAGLFPMAVYSGSAVPVNWVAIGIEV